MTDSFERLADDLDRAVGFKLFTALLVVPPEVERVYTNMPEAFPLAGRKRLDATPWGKLVIEEGRTWLGNTRRDMESVFPDHAIIASVGCGSCINIPVLHRGSAIGTLNMLDAEHAYTAAHVEKAAAFAERAVPLFQQAAKAEITKD